MTLRTKFFFSFFVTAVAPLIIVGVLTFQNARDEITIRVIDQLEAVADIQEKRLNEVIESYLEQIKLVASRTQLRRSLEAYMQGNDPHAVDGVTQILLDTRDTVSSIERVAVFDTRGTTIASTDKNEVGNVIGDTDYFALGKESFAIYGLFKDDQNVLKLRIVGPIVAGGEVVGVLEVVADLGEIVAITEDYTGLGNTGEFLLVEKNQYGDAVFITPLRYDTGAALRRAIPAEKTHIPAISAVSGQEKVLISDDTVDYRGVQVLAVTRFVDSLRWGIVVKVDRSDAFSPVIDLARQYAVTLLVVTVLVLLVSFLLSYTITDPIKSLVRFAEVLQSEGFTTRATIKTSGEVGRLADALNEMAGRLQGLYKNLESNVRERTQKLEVAQKTLSEKLDETERLNKVMVGRELKMMELKDEIKRLRGGEESKLKKQKNTRRKKTSK